MLRFPRHSWVPCLACPPARSHAGLTWQGVCVFYLGTGWGWEDRGEGCGLRGWLLSCCIRTETRSPQEGSPARRGAEVRWADAHVIPEQGFLGTAGGQVSQLCWLAGSESRAMTSWAPASCPDVPLVGGLLLGSINSQPSLSPAPLVERALSLQAPTPGPVSTRTCLCLLTQNSNEHHGKHFFPFSPHNCIYLWLCCVFIGVPEVFSSCREGGYLDAVQSLVAMGFLVAKQALGVWAH